MKHSFNRFRKYQFWYITYIETFFLGVVFLALDYLFDNHLSIMLLTLSPPFFGIFMIVVGASSFVSMLTKQRLWPILLNSFVWCYISVASILDVFDPTFPFRASSVEMSVMGIALCLRIALNGYKVVLDKPKEDEDAIDFQ